MLTAIDHIIIGTVDLAQTTKIFSEKLGLLASGGGRHPFGGTENRIIVIGDTYLELIAVYAPEEAQESMLYRIEQGDGYLNMVLASDNITADSAAMRQRGLTIIGPNAGELRSADGKSRGWSRTDVERPDLAQRYPFLIQHDSGGEERRHRLAGWQTPPVHPLGVKAVISATLAVEDLGEATQRFQHIYGLQASHPYSGEAEGWDATLVKFTLGEQTQSFELASPTSLLESESRTTQIQLPTRGALAQHLQLFGESLCRMTLAVESLEKAQDFLDQQGVHYTYQDEPVACLWIHPDQASGASIILRA